MNRTENLDHGVVGDLGAITEWAVFAPFTVDDPLPQAADLVHLPEVLDLGGTRRAVEWVKPCRGQCDLRALLGEPPYCYLGVAYAFIELRVSEGGEVSLGFGCDMKMRAWLNGQPLWDGQDVDGERFPPQANGHRMTVTLRSGSNILAVRFIAAKGSAILAIGGPHELRSGDFRSLLEDPAVSEPYWSRLVESAVVCGGSAVEIGSRRELFIDDFLIDDQCGDVELKLHHPVPRETVVTFGVEGKPWEGNIGYPALVEHDGGFRLYYSGRPRKVADESPDQVTCLMESSDGIHWQRPQIGLFDYKGSKDNNIVWRGKASHNFTPFIDKNPAAAEDARFKAVGYHPDGGALGAYASADGILWRMFTERPIVTVGAMDSQNVAFWDSHAGVYREYHRCCRGGMPGDEFSGHRDVMTSVSEDFIHWSEPRHIDYDDDRLDEMYTNGIRPYARAPHLLIGTPARYVKPRRKVADHPNCSISDAVLITSRDGARFRRWSEGFIRPGWEPEVWTDRNNYPAWGMLQLCPEELSIYWGEHNKHPRKRLRRGTIRTDGFVSLHAGVHQPGEILTRPLHVTGNRLELNYATSAIGTVMIELCDEEGQPIRGFSMADSEVLYGNEISHTFSWRGCVTDVSPVTQKPVRLRIRLHDADVYSFRFFEAT